MRGLDLLDFISKYSEGVTHFLPIEEAEKYFDETVAKKLFIPKFHKGKLIGVCTYYRTASIEEAVAYDTRGDMPDAPDKGPYAYVSFVCVHPSYRNTGIMDYFVKRLENLNPPIKAAVWVDPAGQWKVIERSNSMRTNCGILAFDQIAGMLNGRANVLSLSTLARIAQDNEFILYPLKVKREQLIDLQHPYILHNDFHFQIIRGDEDLLGFALPEEVYVAATDMNVGVVVDEDEARTIKGAKKFFKQIFAPYIAPIAAAAIPGVGPWIAPIVAGAGQMVNASTRPGDQSFGDLAKAGLIGAGTYIGGSAFGGAALSGLGKLAGQGALGTALSSAGNIAGATGKAYSGLIKGALGSLTGGGSKAAVGSAMGSTMGSAASAAPSALSNMASTGAASAGSMGGNSALSFYSPSGFIPNLSSAISGGASKGANMLGGMGSKLGLGLGALSMGGSLLTGLKKPSGMEIPDELQQYYDMMQSTGGRGNINPAASNELNRGINAGVGGIFPTTDNAFMDAAMRRIREDADRRKTDLGNYYAQYGRVNSPEFIDQLGRLDEEVSNREQDLQAQIAESNRAQNISGMQNYLDLAMRGDQLALSQLADAVGGISNAQLALANYRAGQQAALSQSLGGLGTSLLANYFNPANKILERIATRIGG